MHKYRYDPFFRSEAHIIILQFGLAVFLLIVVGVAANQLYNDASMAVSKGIIDALQPHSTPVSIGVSVINALDYTRSRTVILAVSTIVFITFIFTYIITRVALAPTRNALQSQKQFIGNVAHELRTPLAVGKTNLEVALMQPIENESVRKSLVSTVEELDRISEIINNLLSLSASTRAERIEFRDVDLGDVVETAIRTLRTLIDSKQIELELRISDRRAVWGNPVALEQIVMNILKNAITHTLNRGRILVAIEPVYPDFMELRVHDSGTGIARKDLFRVFEPYYRADPSRKRGEGGGGLGLTIVSELIKLHNGKITIRSAEGRGTNVTVLLPAGNPLVGDAEHPSEVADTVSEIAVDYSHNSYHNL